MNKYLILLQLFSVGALISLPCRSTFASDFHSARTAGLAGAGHAAPMLNDAVYLNPSYQSFMPTYSVGGNFTWFSGPSEKDPHGRAYSVSVMDGRSELFGAGAAYTLREDGSFVHVGASKALLKTLGIGLGGKFYFNNPALLSGRDMTVSITGAFFKDLITTLILDNVFESSAGLPRGLYREYTFGTKYNLMDLLILYADPHFAPNVGAGKFGHEIGAEIVVFSDLYLRLGHFQHANQPQIPVRGRGYAFGIGWIGPRLSLDYAYERMDVPFSSHAQNISFTAYF